MLSHNRSERSVARLRSRLLAVLVVATLAPCAPANAKGTPPQQFTTPEDAVNALVAAIKAHDRKALVKVLGSDAEKLVDSGDAVADHESGEHFLKQYEEANSIVKSGDDKATLQVGKDEWPFPIPLAKSGQGWGFDTKAGEEEVIDRRIGRNELAAMNVCLAYVDAQREYYARNPDHDKLAHYAQQFGSTPGKRDGLYWPTKDGEDESPLGALVAHAHAHGYRREGGKPTPYHGYYYRILTAQGADAAGGAYDYVAHGKMIGGFALVAYPAQYDNSGVATFLVNHDGVVFEKDLGPTTTRVAEAMKLFNPDSTWKRSSVDANASN